MCLWNIPPDWTGENWAKGFHCGTAPPGAWISGVFLPTEFHLHLGAQHVYRLTFWIVYELHHTPPVKENGITLKTHRNLSFLPLLIFKKEVCLSWWVCVCGARGGGCTGATVYLWRWRAGFRSLLASSTLWDVGIKWRLSSLPEAPSPLSHPIGPVSLILVNGNLSSI